MILITKRLTMIIICISIFLHDFAHNLYHDNHYELITSPDSVMFINLENDTLYGVGFESDMDLTEFKITKPRGVKNN